ncbi:MAG: hypothetical protein HYU57_02220 [Micavibrio aeruginosavorus]|nr:hypothetical protein [Micavibrio aeruginosavorus]
MTRAATPSANTDSRKADRDVLFARPANGNDVFSMIGVLQSYMLLAGDHFMIAKNFLEIESGKSLVAVGKGGEILMYNNQVRPSPQSAFRLVRGFALAALAKRGRDNTPCLSLMADWSDAATRDMLETLGARKLVERPIRTLVGERTMALCEIDGLAEKFTRAPGRHSCPCARTP